MQFAQKTHSRFSNTKLGMVWSSLGANIFGLLQQATPDRSNHNTPHCACVELRRDSCQKCVVADSIPRVSTRKRLTPSTNIEAAGVRLTERPRDTDKPDGCSADWVSEWTRLTKRGQSKKAAIQLRFIHWCLIYQLSSLA